MLEVWHSKTVKQFVKTTEKHWGIGTVSQRPVMATCLTQGSGPGSSLSSSAGSPSALMFLETSPYILPLCPFSVCSSTLSLGSLALPLFLCFQTGVTQSLLTWAVCAAECLGDAHRWCLPGHAESVCIEEEAEC